MCSTIKDFYRYCAGVQKNPRPHFIPSTYLEPNTCCQRQGHACRGSFELAIIDKFDRNVTPLSEMNNKSHTTQVQSLSTVFRSGTYVSTIRLYRCTLHPYTTLKSSNIREEPKVSHSLLLAILGRSIFCVLIK